MQGFTGSTAKFNTMMTALEDKNPNSSSTSNDFSVLFKVSDEKTLKEGLIASLTGQLLTENNENKDNLQLLESVFTSMEELQEFIDAFNKLHKLFHIKIRKNR